MQSKEYLQGFAAFSPACLSNPTTNPYPYSTTDNKKHLDWRAGYHDALEKYQREHPFDPNHQY